MSASRRGLRPTRQGWLFLLTTFGIGAAAVNTGNNLLYLVLGLMLSLIVLSGVLSDLVLWGVRVRRVLPARAFARTPCVVELGLANEKRGLPTYSIEIEDRAEREPTDRRCYFLKVSPGTEQIAGYRRSPSRRGRLGFAGFRLTTRYPFGLFEKWRTLDDPAELLVYPALLPVPSPAASAGVALDDRLLLRRGHGTETSGLREHRDGDEARTIHWRRSAALGRLVSREREEDGGRRVTILLDEARPEGAAEAWERAFEDSVSRAASLAALALGQGASVQVVARSGASPVVPSGSAPDPLLRFLALLASVPAADAPALPRIEGLLVRPDEHSPEALA